MTVEAVHSHNDQGIAIAETELKSMHITMQTLGRIDIIGGRAMVDGVGGWLAKTLSYSVMYELALLIPAISVLGVTIGQNRVRLRYQAIQKQIQLIIAAVKTDVTERIVDDAKAVGDTGSTKIPSHGTGIHETKTFFGLTLEAQTDLVLFL